MEVGMGPQQKGTGKTVSTSTEKSSNTNQCISKGERDRNLFIQIRFLSRSLFFSFFTPAFTSIL
ncbi:hypothetical protein [Staphylococcus marylandisciuri]|uniref:hypothetical protein n=1 Tax=Staphylococcus marylandisciuri TaxID=2981529 RepID=UPI0021D234E6|nr:hypothetical protein [Staphylococcus marylandisciuri]